MVWKNNKIAFFSQLYSYFDDRDETQSAIIGFLSWDAPNSVIRIKQELRRRAYLNLAEHPEVSKDMGKAIAAITKWQNGERNFDIDWD